LEALMGMVRLAGLGLAVVAMSGAAWGQVRSEKRPTYEEALTSVTWGGCQRADAERFIRFYCPEGEALWYFTVEGRPEHETYFVGPVRESGRGMPIFGDYRVSRSPSQEVAPERIRAHQEWVKGILKIWREDAERMRLLIKRDRGRLYPLEPQ
jgi:hypothetical protein